ncbi:lutropin-choriogonadotropic hormone receptor isoform X1 [Oncorhynchus keta]|uniref:lutropin-choriogonadotropic hormone receptor isoform X1 n=1 Tax=Oncorhynchus keta TaxID=8018 RepID=UPI0015F7FEA3|nr:lutropin-choriogonadotropic hormone receptor isoform X1 [Oncorhynchus keta]
MMSISLLFLFYPSVLLFFGFGCRYASSFVCPGICRCSANTIRCNNITEKSVPTSERGPRLVLKHLTMSTIASHTFDGLRRVQHIEIGQSVALETIETLAFNNLLDLNEIFIKNIRSLVHIARRTFNNLPKLRYLSISNTGITVFPDMTSIHSLEPWNQNFVLDICDNLYLLSIPVNAFVGMTTEYTAMNLFNNGIREIQDYAFNGTKINKLVLKNNRNLQVIHREAFKGAVGPRILCRDQLPILERHAVHTLDVSSTAIETLPSHGLNSVVELVARTAYGLKRLPPFRDLGNLQKAHLTYNSHCCALLTWDTHRDSPINAAQHNGSWPTYCDDSPYEKFPAGMVDSSDTSLLVEIHGTNEDVEDESYGGVDFQYPELGLNCQTRPTLQCTPEADAFNPCEDIAGFSFLRVAIWFINILAIIGNLTVLLIFFTSRCKLTVPRFLMCHLAFADFCIGVYLLMIAAVDLHTRGHYSEHAIDWQTGAGCSAAGFLSVFGGELSVYTLSTITLERWHTITHALQLEKRLGLAQAAVIMAGGWLICLGMAMLPLVGVSSYSRVSMCLPMDVKTPLAQAFILLLLLFNVGAFLVVCVCYVLIYLAVRNPQFPSRSADAKIAKRMAVLIFTDLLCMAPISFFAISAAFKVPLITVTNSKILLVLFFPINSCANPFLYAIFTKAFRKDVYLLLSNVGCCENKANMYRMKAYCSENLVKSSSGNKGTLICTTLSMDPLPLQSQQLKDDDDLGTI